MKASFLICIAIFLYVDESLLAQDPSTKDVFPLSIGNSWKYSYEFSNIDIGNSDGSVQYDSGMVLYVVVDSTSNVDTNFWQIKKNYTLTRTLEDIEALEVAHETTYAVIDSAIFTMYEMKNGNHQLIIEQGSSVALWPIVASDYDTSTICRYQVVDSINKTSIVKIRFFDPSMYYQLTFHADSGLTSNIASGDLGYHSHSGTNIIAHLVENHIILRVPLRNEPVLPSSTPGLFQNYPNPFNPATILSYTIPSRSLVSLKVFNILGQEVMNFGSSLREPGYYEQNLDASALASGVYLYQIQTFDLRHHDLQFMASKKLLFIK